MPGILSSLYWIILILSLIGMFGPTAWPGYYRFTPIAVLLVIIGLKTFPVPL